MLNTTYMAFISSNCCDDVKKFCMEYPELDDPDFVSLLNDYIITNKEFTELINYDDTKALLRKSVRCGDNILKMIYKLDKMHTGIDNQLKRVSNRLGALIGRKSSKVLKMKKIVIISMETCMRVVLNEFMTILKFVRKLIDVEKKLAVQMEKKQSMLKVKGS